jgi:hypothetical protein
MTADMKIVQLNFAYGTIIMYVGGEDDKKMVKREYCILCVYLELDSEL